MAISLIKSETDIRKGDVINRVEQNLTMTFAFMDIIEKIGDEKNWNDDIIIEYLTESYHLAKEIKFGEKEHV